MWLIMSQIVTCILLENAGREHLPTKGFEVSPDIAALGFLVNSFGFYIKKTPLSHSARQGHYICQKVHMLHSMTITFTEPHTKVWYISKVWYQNLENDSVLWRTWEVPWTLYKNFATSLVFSEHKGCSRIFLCCPSLASYISLFSG